MKKMTSKTVQHGGVSGNRFFSNHNSCVRSVAFNPKERYLFCSGGNDGQIAIYHAGRAEMLNTHSVISSGLNRHVSAVGFACCGQKILAATSSRRVSVIDVEHGTAIQSYDNCAFSPSRDRTPMALDPTCPNIAACSYVNGKGITILDTRLPLPLNFIFDFHSETIRDITFLHESWPFLKPSSSSPSSSSSSLLETKVGGHNPSGYTLLSLSSQGVAKVTSLDGRLLHTFDYGHPANSIAATPEHYGSTHDGFASAWVCGGNFISSYVPNEETLRPQQPQQQLSNIDHSISLPSQIHFNPTYNPNIGGNPRRNNADGNANSSNNQQPWNQSFNVIISNPNNVNLNVYQMPRRNELIFGSIDSLRISRAIRSLVASSHQQVNNNNNNSNSSNENSSNSQLLQSSSTSSSSSTLSQVLGAGAVAVNSNTGNNNNPGSSRSNHSGVSSNNRFRRTLVHQIPFEQMRFNLERNENNNQSNNSITNNNNNNNNDNNYVNNILNDYHDDDEDDDDEDDDDEEDDDDDENGNGNEDRHLDTVMIDYEYQTTINRKIDLHTPINSFVKKTLFYHDHWDRTPAIPDHPQQIWRLRFSSNGAHLFAAGEGGFVRSYRRYPNLAMHCVGEVYRHRNDIVDMDISPYDEFLVTASKDKTVGFICLGSPSHGWTEYYEYT